MRVFCIGLLIAVAAQVAALADDRPAGELWKQTVSMEMPGMTMPSDTVEVCVPPGKANEALSKPQPPGNGNCTVHDAKHDGNRFTARFSCTGNPPIEGTIESVVEGDHGKATLTMSVSGQQMTMKSESHKVGTACTPTAVPDAH